MLNFVFHIFGLSWNMHLLILPRTLGSPEGSVLCMLFLFDVTLSSWLCFVSPKLSGGILIQEFDITMKDELN